MLKSDIGPWTLRLFADGLPPPRLSLLMDPSVRFIGQAVDDFEPKLPLTRFSALEVVVLGAVMKSMKSSFSFSVTDKNASSVHSYCACVEPDFLKGTEGVLPP